MDITELLAFSVKNKASDLHLSSGLPPMIRVHGDVRRINLPAMEHKDVHGMVYDIMNDGQRKVYEETLECDFSFEIPNLARFRVNAFNQQRGAAAVFRTIPSKVLTLEELNAPKIFKEISEYPRGIVLVTGPTGSGKTTTLYSCLHFINRPDRKIITVEDPVEYRLPGVNQVQANEKIDLSFARVLRAMLRQDPDVILVGEMRDPETAQIALRAAMTGHLVLSTLHTNDAASTPVRLLDMGVPAFMVATSVQGVLAQRLLRRVCDHCKAPHTLTPQEQVWLGSAAENGGDTGFVAGRGCDRCHHTGYAGRRAIHELLEIDATLADSLAREEPARFVATARASLAGHTLRDQALALARAGATSLAEAMRVSAQDDTA